MAFSPETFGSAELRQKVTSRKISRMSSTATFHAPNSNLSSTTPCPRRPHQHLQTRPKNHRLVPNLDLQFAIRYLWAQGSGVVRTSVTGRPVRHRTGDSTGPISKIPNVYAAQ